MSEDSKRAMADQMWREIVQTEPPSDDANSFIARTRAVVFGEVWNEPGLTRRERRLISLTVTAGVGDIGLELHVRAAIESGDFDRESINAFIMHLAVYAGWPVAGRVSQIAARCFAKSDP
jgi:4-carboxymuconolactone decarboxylase